MCRRVECRTCGKPGFKGCGAHVEQVLADVRPDDRCRCLEEARNPSDGDRGSSAGILDRVRTLLGR